MFKVTSLDNKYFFGVVCIGCVVSLFLMFS